MYEQYLGKYKQSMKVDHILHMHEEHLWDLCFNKIPFESEITLSPAPSKMQTPPKKTLNEDELPAVS